MISKELLSEVLGVEVCEAPHKSIVSPIIAYKYKDTEGRYQKQINIHELAHKCKVWALNREVMFMSYTHKHGAECVYHPYSHNNEISYRKIFSADGGTEPEAIFKACQWILDNDKSTT